MRVIVTRPAGQAEAWVRSLRSQGVDAVALPLIDIEPLADLEPLRAAWAALPQFMLVFFASPNAVAGFFAARPAGAAWPDGTWAGAPGPGTAQALGGVGIPPAQMRQPPADSSRFDSEALWATLVETDWSGHRILVVRGESGRDWLADQARAAGAQVEAVAAYRRRPPQLDAAGQAVRERAIESPGETLWLLSSSEAVRHLAALSPAEGPALPPGSRALATHPRIAETARAAGFTHVWSCAPSLAAVRAAIASIEAAGPIVSGEVPAAGPPLQSSAP